MLKALLIADANTDDPWTLGLKAILEENCHFAVEITSDAESLLSDAIIAFDYDLFVVGAWSGLPDGVARDNFLGSLADGAGLVIVIATSTDVPHDSQSETLADIKVPTAGNAASSSVTYLDHHHPVTRALRDFEINCAVSSTALDPASDAFILASATSPAIPTPFPVIAVTRSGRGRIFQTTLGNPRDLSTLEIDGFRRSLVRGAEWASTGNVLDF